MHRTAAKEQALGIGAFGMALYYYLFVAKPRLGDNYIAIFVEPSCPPLTISRAHNWVTVETSTPHYFRVGQQIQISDVAHNLAGISEISRKENGIVTVTTGGPHGFTDGEQVQIADVIDPSFNGQVQVLSIVHDNTFTYEQTDKAKAGESRGGIVQDVWNGTFVIKSVETRSFTYWQVGPDNPGFTTIGTATVAAPVNTNLTVAGSLAVNHKSGGLTGSATLIPPPSKSDELFKKGDLLMFRIPNHHDYYNISMTLSAGTGLTFVSETAEKTAK
jgi:hypothetical protein